MTQNRWQLPHDWYAGGISSNVIVGKDVYIDSSYAFAATVSTREPAVVLGDACGVYDRASFVVGPNGFVEVGAFTCLNGTYLLCEDHIQIGSHCLLAWGVVITDCHAYGGTPVDARRAALSAAATRPDRPLPAVTTPRPVRLEDNVWVGFDSVILPSVTLGRGCIVGCKTIIAQDVAPYTIVVGDPPRAVRTLSPDDTPEARRLAFEELARR